MQHLYRLFVCGLVAVGLTACSEKPDVGLVGDEGEDEIVGTYPDLPPDVIEIEEGVYVQPGIHLRQGIELFPLAPESESDLAADGPTGRVTVTGAALSELEGIDKGDILVTSDLIAMVSTVEPTTDGLEITLRSFELWEAVHGQWEIEIPLDRGEGETYDLEPSDYEVRRQLLGNTASLSVKTAVGPLAIETTSSLSYDVSPVLKFEGTIPFYKSETNYQCDYPQVDVNVGCNPFGCIKRWKYCVNHVSLKIVLSADYESSLSLTATAEDALEYPEDKRIVDNGLGRIPLGSTPFYLRPGFYIDRQAYAKVALEGELSVTASAGATVPLGFEYNNGAGGGSWSMIPNRNNPVTTRGGISAEASLAAKLEVGAWGEAGFGLSVCAGFPGGSACVEGVTAGGRVTAKGVHEDGITTGPLPDHCLSASVDVSAKVTATAKGKFNALGLDETVTLFTATFTPASYNIASWDGGGEYCSGEHQKLVADFNARYDIDLDCDDAEENTLIGTCAEAFTAPCFDPSGTCTGFVYEDGSYDQNWTSGEHIFGTPLDWSGATDETGFVTEYEQQMFGATGNQCVAGQSVIKPMLDNQYDCRSTTDLTLLVSDEEGLGGGFQEGDVLSICVLDTGAQIFTCPDGTMFTLGSDKETLCSVGGPCRFEAADLSDLEENRDLGL